MFAPAQSQGKAIGVFRSLGALARVFGPVMASIIYWKYNSSYPYLLGAIIILIPIIMVGKLPKIPENLEKCEA
jgi:MFS family permease